MALEDVTLAAARATLASAGIGTKSTNRAYLVRLARNIRRQQAAGLPVSREAARGHRATPEHPNRKRPALPARASLYPGRRSKYERHTQPIIGLGKAPPAPPGTRPEVTRPLRHDRVGEVTKGRTTVAFAGRFNESIVDVYTDRRAAKRRLQEIQREDPKGRVIIDVYDCTLKRGARWTRLFDNPAQKGFHVPDPGISVTHLLEMMEEREYNLEEIAVAWAGSGDYPARGPKVTHACIFNIYYFPRADLDAWRDRFGERTRATGKNRRKKQK